MKKMNPEEKIQLETLYLTEHKTMAEIGAILGVTRQSVHARMRRHGIDRSLGERFPILCHSCGDVVPITRKRFLRADKHFCNSTCYATYLRSPEFKQLQADKRLAKIADEEAKGIRPVAKTW